MPSLAPASSNDNLGALSGETAEYISFQFTFASARGGILSMQPSPGVRSMLECMKAGYRGAGSLRLESEARRPCLTQRIHRYVPDSAQRRHCEPPLLPQGLPRGCRQKWDRRASVMQTSRPRRRRASMGHDCLLWGEARRSVKPSQQATQVYKGNGRRSRLLPRSSSSPLRCTALFPASPDEHSSAWSNRTSDQRWTKR